MELDTIRHSLLSDLLRSPKEESLSQSRDRRKRGRETKMASKIAGLYDMEDTLGSGHFAVVKSARHVFTG